MKRLSRDEFAAAALTGILSSPMPLGEDLGHAVKQAFRLADEAVKHSAPVEALAAVEALEALVQDVRLIGLAENNRVIQTVRAAEAVLARYKETRE